MKTVFSGRSVKMCTLMSSMSYFVGLVVTTLVYVFNVSRLVLCDKTVVVRSNLIVMICVLVTSHGCVRYECAAGKVSGRLCGRLVSFSK